jgi:hypothetical protein
MFVNREAIRIANVDADADREQTVLAAVVVVGGTTYGADLKGVEWHDGKTAGDGFAASSSFGVRLAMRRFFRNIAV